MDPDALVDTVALSAASTCTRWVIFDFDFEGPVSLAASGFVTQSRIGDAGVTQPREIVQA